MVECKFGAKCTKGAKCRFLHSKVDRLFSYIDLVEHGEERVDGP